MIPIDFSFIFAVEELYGTQYQSGSFSLFNVGSGFHCLRIVFLFFSSTLMAILKTTKKGKTQDQVYTTLA